MADFLEPSMNGHVPILFLVTRYAAPMTGPRMQGIMEVAAAGTQCWKDGVRQEAPDGQQFLWFSTEGESSMDASYMFCERQNLGPFLQSRCTRSVRFEVLGCRMIGCVYCT